MFDKKSYYLTNQGDYDCEMLSAEKLDDVD
jgi:hypothetical protein